jgi:DNA-binding Lrp family transcriptional regulator
LDKKLLQRIQSDFPLVPRPFAALASDLNLSEAEIMERLVDLQEAGYIRRIGPILDNEALGRSSTLAAMACPESRIDEVAGIVSAYPEVSHNYLRKSPDHPIPYNLWFTLSAWSTERIGHILREISRKTGLSVHNLPTRKRFKLGVRLRFD